MANYFTNVGKGLTTALLQAGSWYQGWGTGATGSIDATSTTLSTETTSTSNSGGNNTRPITTSSQQTTTTTNDTVKFVATLTADAGKTITNMGIFNSNGAQASPAAPSGGSLLFIAPFTTGYVLNTSDSIQFSVSLIFS